MLDDGGIAYELNSRLVRGLDYYSRTVFEWVTDRLGAQGTICAGGRYDGLVEYLGGRATPAVGFALGLERLLALLAVTGVTLPKRHPHVYLVLGGERAVRRGMVFADELRRAIAGLRVLANCGGGSFKSQFKRADRSGARYALVLGDDEVERQSVTLKPLRSDDEQETVTQQEMVKRLGEILADELA
jgi:histidyl-tRNA synthetase